MKNETTHVERRGRGLLDSSAAWSRDETFAPKHAMVCSHITPVSMWTWRTCTSSHSGHDCFERLDHLRKPTSSRVERSCTLRRRCRQIVSRSRKKIERSNKVSAKRRRTHKSDRRFRSKHPRVHTFASGSCSWSAPLQATRLANNARRPTARVRPPLLSILAVDPLGEAPVGGYSLEFDNRFRSGRIPM